MLGWGEMSIFVENLIVKAEGIFYDRMRAKKNRCFFF